LKAWFGFLGIEAAALASYIRAAWWFTASTSFANPAAAHAAQPIAAVEDSNRHSCRRARQVFISQQELG
jgi:hypothetical protein